MYIHKAHLHALVDFYSPVIVVVQLFVDVPQRLQTEAVGVAHAWRHHYETGVCRGHTQKIKQVRDERITVTAVYTLDIAASVVLKLSLAEMLI